MRDGSDLHRRVKEGDQNIRLQCWSVIAVDECGPPAVSAECEGQRVPYERGVITPPKFKFHHEPLNSLDIISAWRRDLRPLTSGRNLHM